MISLLAPLFAIAALAPLGQQEPLAPDGHRGFGAQTGPDETLALFRQPDADDRAFLAGLAGLETSLEVQVASAQALYRTRGYFAVLERGEPETLEALDAAFDRASEDLAQNLARRGERARALASMFCDVRFRVRRAALEGWRLDARELRGALALFGASCDGWVRLDDGEARDVAARADLAASLLRARLKDLEALREAPGGASEVDEAAVEALLEGARADDAGLLAREGERMGLAARAAEGLLFLTRLREREAERLAWRNERIALARTKRDEVALWDPEGDAGKAVPPDVRRRKKTTRRREALGRARQGLAHDPFDDELALAAARLARLVSGDLETLDLYDRYLALRGIRTHDEATWGDLTREEQDAIYYVQSLERQEGQLPTPGEEEEGS